MAKSSVNIPPEVLKTIEFETSEDVDVTPTFDSLNLKDDLLRGIYAYGLSTCIRSYQMFLCTPVECGSF